MANGATNIPNIITQVSKDSLNNNTQPQTNYTNAQDGNQIRTDLQLAVSQADEDKTTKRSGKFSFFGFLCCCFSRPSSPPVLPTTNQIIQNNGSQTGPPVEGYLLAPLSSDTGSKKTLVLDLDETLVHSSFKPIPNPDFIIPVEIEDQVYKVYVLKRPGVDQFLKALGDKFEIVVFTASLAKYADPVLDLLDTYKVVRARLFREACTNYNGNFVKDLSRLGRDIKHSLIVDNSPTSYLFHPENAVPCESWFDDENDTELLEFIPVFESIAKVDDVRVAIQEAKLNGRIRS